MRNASIILIFADWIIVVFVCCTRMDWNMMYFLKIPKVSIFKSCHINCLGFWGDSALWEDGAMSNESNPFSTEVRERAVLIIIPIWIMPSAEKLGLCCDSTRNAKHHQRQLVGISDTWIANKFNVAVVPRQALLVVITVVAATFMPKAPKLFQGSMQTSWPAVVKCNDVNPTLSSTQLFSQVFYTVHCRWPVITPLPALT